MTHKKHNIYNINFFNFIFKKILGTLDASIIYREDIKKKKKKLSNKSISVNSRNRAGITVLSLGY